MNSSELGLRTLFNENDRRFGQAAAMIGMQQFQVNDIVQLAGGQRLIVTEYKPSRPANPYLGVLVGGQGKEYKFGSKHCPRKVGVAPPDHPALVARRGRPQRGGGVSQDYRAVVGQLLDAVERGDLVTAKVLAKVIRGMP